MRCPWFDFIKSEMALYPGPAVLVYTILLHVFSFDWEIKLEPFPEINQYWPARG